jgi:hypothetical protein
MTAAAVTLNGHACAPGTRLQAGYTGVWWADIDLTEPVALEAGTAAALHFAGTDCTGTVVSGGVADGRAAYRVVGGAGGWNQEIPRQSYQADNGIKISKVIADAAGLVGETVADAPTGVTGKHFTRATGPASHTLHLVAPNSWRVDFDGVTRFGARASSAYAGGGTVTRRVPGSGLLELAVDSTAGLVPGVTVEGSAPASDVEFELSAGRIVVRVWASLASTPASRRNDARRRIQEAMFPALRYAGTYEYRIVTQVGERLNLQIVRAATRLPDLPRVSIRQGIPGAKATHALGSLVLVTFIDRDPGRPAVVAFDEPGSAGWMPTFLEFGDAPTLGVVRLGDPVQAGPFAGVNTGASARIKAGL